MMPIKCTAKERKKKKTVQVALSKRKKLTMLCHFFKPQLPHMLKFWKLFSGKKNKKTYKLLFGKF